MTVFENVALGLRAKRTRNLIQNVKEALRAVRLDGVEGRYPHQPSGGQQCVAFAREIAAKPTCILFEEPLSARDVILLEMEIGVENESVTSKKTPHRVGSRQG